MARPDNDTRRPRDWNKAVTAAAMVQIGATQEQAAKAAGIGDRTLRDWMGCAFWDDAMTEALAKYTTDLHRLCLKAVFDAVRDGDANLALKVLERIDPKAWGQRANTSVVVDVTDTPEADSEELLSRGRRVLIALSTPKLPE